MKNEHKVIAYFGVHSGSFAAEREEELCTVY